MLIEKIDKCSLAINDLLTLRSNVLGVNAFEGAIKKLADVDSMVTELVATVEEMNKHDFCQTNLTEDTVEKMRDAITNCATAVNNMSLSSNDVLAVTAVFKAQKEVLTALWKATAKAYVTPVRSFLDIIQAFAENTDEISKLSKALYAGSIAEPTAAVVRTLVENVQKANTITSDFKMDEGVRTFLQKVKNNSATYEDITPEVSQWIEEHNLRRKIKLSFV